MNHSSLFVGLCFTAAAVVSAQTGLPTPQEPAASEVMVVPAKPQKPARKPLSPEELRKSATFPGELHPEEPVKPQLVVPIGRKPPPPLPSSTSEPSVAMGPAGKIDDSVARCKALAPPERKAACGKPSVKADDAAE